MKTIIKEVLEMNEFMVLVYRYDGLREWVSNKEFIEEINRLLQDYEFRESMLRKEKDAVIMSLKKQLDEVNNAYEGLDI